MLKTEQPPLARFVESPLLAGVEEPDTGAVTREPPGLSVAYLVQERSADGLSGDVRAGGRCLR